MSTGLTPAMKAGVDEEIKEFHKNAVNKWRAITWDYVERAGWSAGQQFFAVLFTTTTVATVAGLPWASASVMAVGAAIISLLTTAVEYTNKALKTASYGKDLALRLVKTFASSLLGAMGAEAVFDFLHFGWIAALNIAAVATLAALGKGLLARDSTDTPNASTLKVQTYNDARGLPVAR